MWHISNRSLYIWYHSQRCFSDTLSSINPNRISVQWCMSRKPYLMVQSKKRRLCRNQRRSPKSLIYLRRSYLGRISHIICPQSNIDPCRRSRRWFHCYRCRRDRRRRDTCRSRGTSLRCTQQRTCCPSSRSHRGIPSRQSGLCSFHIPTHIKCSFHYCCRILRCN